MKTKAVKRQEAEQRTEARAKRNWAQQLAYLNENDNAAMRERLTLVMEARKQYDGPDEMFGTYVKERVAYYENKKWAEAA